MKLLRYTFLIISFLVIGVYILYSVSKKNINNNRFAIVIPSYKNSDWYKFNLNSVFAQSYPHYRVIYIDDCSPDGTYTLVKTYIESLGKTEKVTLIKNEKRQGPLANHFKAIHMCRDNEIIVCLDGDDWFANDDVLEYLNFVYQDPNVWLTYGQFCNWPTGELGWCEAIPPEIVQKNKFREFGYVSVQLRTYYAWLAKLVKKEDLQTKEGNFFPVAGDVALMFPMHEMAGKHFKFISRILVQRNVATPINEFKVSPELQIKTVAYISRKQPYNPL